MLIAMIVLAALPGWAAAVAGSPDPAATDAPGGRAVCANGHRQIIQVGGLLDASAAHAVQGLGESGPLCAANAHALLGSGMEGVNAHDPFDLARIS